MLKFDIFFFSTDNLVQVVELYHNAIRITFMFIKNLNVKSNWQNIIKFVAISILLAISIPLFTQQIQANAVCTEQLKDQIQKEIDTYEMLEKAPTPIEIGQLNKQQFNDIKLKDTNKNLGDLKSELIQITKLKYGSPDPIVTEDYALKFDGYENNPNNFKATVVINSAFNDGQVLNSDINYNLSQYSSNKFVITEIKDIIGQTPLPDELEYLKKLEKQNFVNGKQVKDNPLGMSDAEWEDIKRLKSEKEKNLPETKYREQYNEYMRDKRPEYKQKKSELIAQKNSLSCNGLQAKAGLANGSYYNRDVASNYAKNWWNSRNNAYANFSLNNLGGDCTNFASQAVQAGGYANEGVTSYWTQNGWYSEKTSNRQFGQVGHNTYPNNSGEQFYTSPSWRGVFTNKNYFKSVPYTSNYYYWYGQANGYSNLWENMFNRMGHGDLVWAALNGGSSDSSFDHTMMITGWYPSSISSAGQEPTFTYHQSDNLNKKFNVIKAQYPNANYVGINLQRQ
jgi:Putative amidase domain